MAQNWGSWTPWTPALTLGAEVPFTWAAGDAIGLSGSYEAATS